MNYQNVLRNGDIINWDEAKIHISQKSLWYNFGVYESIKVVQGKAFFSEEHFDRLIKSATLIGMSYQIPIEKLCHWLTLLCQSNEIKNSLVRVLLLGDPDDGQHSLFMFPLGLTFYPDKYYRRGQKVITYHGERFIPKSKSLNMLVNYIAFGEAKKKSAIDALLIDRNQHVVEGTRTNFFGVENSVVIGPRSEQVLDGVTRAKVLDLVERLKIRYQERDITLSELLQFDEIFLTSTSTNVMPIVQVDERQIGDGLVGPVSNKLILEYRKFLKEIS